MSKIKRNNTLLYLEHKKDSDPASLPALCMRLRDGLPLGLPCPSFYTLGRGSQGASQPPPGIDQYGDRRGWIGQSDSSAASNARLTGLKLVIFVWPAWSWAWRWAGNFWVDSETGKNHKIWDSVLMLWLPSFAWRGNVHISEKTEENDSHFAFASTVWDEHATVVDVAKTLQMWWLVAGRKPQLRQLRESCSISTGDY